MIRLCIFDLGGTIVDKYSLSPFFSMKRIFENRNINVNNNLIFKDMGIEKKEHIRLILNDKYIGRNWFSKYGRYPSDSSLRELYNDFNYYQLSQGIKSIEILPETKSCIELLQKNNISTGVTTGFNKPVMMNIKDKLINNEIYIDNYISSTCLDSAGRPEPHMINHLMDKLSLRDPQKVIKVDDSVSGLLEGKNAGCITIGVTRWSINMKKTSYNDINSREEYIERTKNCKEILREAEPNYIIESLNDLYPLIQRINGNIDSKFKMNYSHSL